MDEPTDGADSLDADAMQLLLQPTPGSLLDRMHIELTSVSRDRVEATMPVAGNQQPYGLLHGGASCVLAETLASLGAGVNAWPERLAYGIEINATHHRAAREGTVRGVAVPLHRGRTVSTWSIEITDDDARLICSARVTCVLREP